MVRVIALVSLALAAPNGWAHPGHPALSPDHVHGTYDADVLLFMALIASLVAATLIVGRISRRRSEIRK